MPSSLVGLDSPKDKVSVTTLPRRILVLSLFREPTTSIVGQSTGWLPPTYRADNIDISSQAFSQNNILRCDLTKKH